MRLERTAHHALGTNTGARTAPRFVMAAPLPMPLPPISAPALDMLDTTSDLCDGLAAIAGAKTVVLVSGEFVMACEVEGSVRSVVTHDVRADVHCRGHGRVAIWPWTRQHYGRPRAAETNADDRIGKAYQH
jgi:hypothetical protein